MIFFTQLIYIKNGQEDIFNQFEAIATSLISKHNGFFCCVCDRMMHLT